MTDTVGFIGLGTMGGPMAQQILAAGHDLIVWDVRAEAAGPLIDAGASSAATAAELAAASDVVFTSLPGPKELEGLVGQPDGLISHMRPGSVHVDLSTGSLPVARRVADVEAAADVAFVDAPVSGARSRAAQGTLTIMASGPKAAFDRAAPMLDAMGDPVFHLDERVGIGTMVKLVNNAIAINCTAAVQEGLVMAGAAGIDMGTLLSVLETSTSSMYLTLARPILSRRFDEAYFKLSLAEKDLRLAIESGAELGADISVASAVHDVYERAVEAGFGEQIFYATLKVLEQTAGVELPVLERKKK
jgi:3-hydroxyisobutyrate dehydrogenase-like beta-hydroxyacid dehydrogenase